MIKRDGHTHTEFCPHGSGDAAEAMVQKAIKMRFTEYSITEHAPLPPEIAEHFGGTREGLDTASISIDQVRLYLDLAHQLQAKYADQIKINVGFEVDYFEDYETWTKEFLDEYGPETSDNLLSVHFMPGKDDKLWCVDYTIDDFAEGFANLIAEPQNLFERFTRLELAATQSDLGQYKPTRLGHITLIRKFQDYFKLPRQLDEKNLWLMTELLEEIKKRGYELDLNTAGVYKEYCNEIYPTRRVVQQAKELGIPVIYGSDAHSIREVGHGYHEVEDFIRE